MSISFDAETPLGKALDAWWQDLQERNGDRAELRRAKTVTDVILLPVFQRACVRFKPYFQYEEQEERWVQGLAVILGLLAHVRQSNAGQSLAHQMAGNPPVVSELRFRRLLQRDRTDLYVSMVRVLRMLGNKANLHDLAQSVYFWNDRVKRDWAFAYFPNTPEKAST